MVSGRLVQHASPTPECSEIRKDVYPSFPEDLRSHRNEEDCSRDVAGSSAYRRRTNRPRPPNPRLPPPSPAPQKKEIKDPAEYNAYVGALQQTDPSAKVSGLEAFLTQYPNSVMKEDAMELLMGAYQQAGNQPKTLETAQKVLLVNPCNIRALALLAYTKRTLAEAGQSATQNLADAGQNGEKGLQCLQTATKPDGTPAPDWEKLKSQTAVIFNGAAGIAAFSAKDYAKAEQFLRASVEGDPTNLRDVYPLALAYLTAGPTEKDVDGLFFIARAANLAQGPARLRSPRSARANTTSTTEAKRDGADVAAR